MARAAHLWTQPWSVPLVAISSSSRGISPSGFCSTQGGGDGGDGDGDGDGDDGGGGGGGGDDGDGDDGDDDGGGGDRVLQQGDQPLRLLQQIG